MCDRGTFSTSDIGKGAVLAVFKQYDEAIRCYDIAMELKPDLSDTYTNKGAVLVKFGLHKEAKKYYDKVAKLKSGDTDTVNE